VSTTAATIIADAFGILNVFMAGEDVPPAIANDALRRLNMMIGSWAQQSLTVPAISREVFDLVAGQGGPSNPYTIGAAGNFVTPRPPNQSSIVGAGLLLTTSSPVVEIPRAVITDDAYQAIQVKELGSALFTYVYYNPTYTADLGTINLWPVPNIVTNDLVLYLERAIAEFADLTTVYRFPPSYDEALMYNLARRLAKPYGREVDEDLMVSATTSLMILKRANFKLSDLANDFARDRRGVYNILTGSTGGGFQ
jgi:hypothetical protein